MTCDRGGDRPACRVLCVDQGGNGPRARVDVGVGEEHERRIARGCAEVPRRVREEPSLRHDHRDSTDAPGDGGGGRVR